MSKLISQEKHFLHLLLVTSKDQSRALLYTITQTQVLAISEIIYNLLQLPLTPNLKIVVEKRRKTLKYIADKSKSIRIRTSSIKKHMTQLLSTLKVVKSQLSCYHEKIGTHTLSQISNFTISTTSKTLHGVGNSVNIIIIGDRTHRSPNRKIKTG